MVRWFRRGDFPRKRNASYRGASRGKVRVGKLLNNLVGIQVWPGRVRLGTSHRDSLCKEHDENYPLLFMVVPYLLIDLSKGKTQEAQHATIHIDPDKTGDFVVILRVSKLCVDRISPISFLIDLASSNLIMKRTEVSLLWEILAPKFLN